MCREKIWGGSLSGPSLYNVQGSPSTCLRFASIAIRPAPRVTEYFIVEEKYPKGIASRRCHLELKR